MVLYTCICAELFLFSCFFLRRIMSPQHVCSLRSCDRTLLHGILLLHFDVFATGLTTATEYYYLHHKYGNGMSNLFRLCLTVLYLKSVYGVLRNLSWCAMLRSVNFFSRNLTSTTYCNTNSKEAFQWTVNIICHEQWYAITSKVAVAVWIECPKWKPKIVNDGIYESLCNGFGFGFGLHIRINFPCTYYYDLLIVWYQSVIFTSYSCTLCYLRSPA